MTSPTNIKKMNWFTGRALFCRVIEWNQQEAEKAKRLPRKEHESGQSTTCGLEGCGMLRRGQQKGVVLNCSRSLSI